MKTYTLITGASKGLGKSFAYEFASHGHNLILVARSIDLLDNLKQDLVSKYNIDVVTIVEDLCLQNAALSLYNKVKELNLVVDVLINNAGIGDIGYFIDSSIEKNQNIINLNIQTLTTLTYYFLQDMKTLDSAYILNVASIGAFTPGPIISVYYASKSYVLSFTEALSEELKDTSIHVMALCPGTIKTSFFDSASNNKEIKHQTKAADPNKVARCAYNKMYKKRTVYIYGITNKLIAFSKRILSMKCLRRITYKIQKKRIKK